jgi:phosphoglycerate dehydrogenase-like enzyme
MLLVLDDWEGRIKASASWQQLKGIVEVKFLDKPLNEVSDEEIVNTQFLMAVRERTILDESVFRRMPALKLILQTGGHAYHIDLAAAAQHNIGVALGRRIKAPLSSVPELTFAFVLGLIHKVHQAERTMRNGEWQLFTGRTLANRRIGILGLGRHGSQVARIAKTFGIDVVAWDRTGSYEVVDGIKRMSLDELLSTSDIVSIHLRLSKESTMLLNQERLSKMKPGALLINTSRGAIIDETALINALTTGTLGGAGLDVFEHEPLAASSPLRTMDNVILTPHIGWTVEEVFEEFSQIACTQLRQFSNGTLAKDEMIA